MVYRSDDDRLIFKFNGGNGAVLCNNCKTIILTGNKIPRQFWDAATNKNKDTYEEIGPQFCCEECEKEWNTKRKEKES